MNLLLREVVAVHGGMERWGSCEVVEATLTTDGLAFRSRFQGGRLRGKRVRVEPHRRTVRIDDYPEQGSSGIWTPDFVSIRTESDVVIERESPRRSFDRFSRNFRWDAGDLLYFCGYALWNYLSFPWLLTDPGVEISQRHTSDGSFILDAIFPDGLPTHSRHQSFHFTSEGQLLRHDYTANVIGRWATAANRCLKSELANGLRLYTRRLVTPRLGRSFVFKAPALVWIELENVRVSSTPAKENL